MYRQPPQFSQQFVMRPSEQPFQPEPRAESAQMDYNQMTPLQDTAQDVMQDWQNSN